MKKITLITIMLIGIAGGAQAQGNATGGFLQKLRLWMNNVIDIRFASNFSDIGPDVTMSFNSVTDYANGVTSGSKTIIIKSNKKFDIDVKATSSNFTYSGTTTPAPVMPVNGVLGLKVVSNYTGAGTVTAPFSTSGYANLSSTSQYLINNASRGGLRNFTVKYKATPGFSYPAGTYSVGVMYTATQQ